MKNKGLRTTAITALTIYLVTFLTGVLGTALALLLGHWGFLSLDRLWVVPLIPILTSLLLGTVMTHTAGRRFVRFIERVNTALKQIAQGNYDVTLDETPPAQEIREIISNFNVMTRELQSTEILRHDFIQNVSHEFKTPLAAIEGYAALLQQPDLTAEQRQAKSKRPAWRLTVPDKVYGFDDGLQGRFEENLAADCGDFIIRRADGVYAYQLAVVTDDGQGGITEVVRGMDLLDSTPRQLYLYEQLGLPAPRFFHVPLLLAPDGRRLSKRDRDLDLGILSSRMKPEELVGRLAHLAGLLDQPEAISPAELQTCFSWDKVPAHAITIDDF
jgi:hypothetical protein